MFAVYLYGYGVFSEQRHGYNWGIDAIINWICMGITSLLSYILKVAQTLIEACWDFLQYASFGLQEESTKTGANSTDAYSLYNIFKRWIWIPIALAFLFFLVKMLYLDKKSDDIKRFTTNIGTLIAVIVFLPTIFVNVNTLIFGTSDNSKILSVDSASLSSRIFYRNTYDYEYMAMAADVNLANALTGKNTYTIDDLMSGDEEVIKSIEEASKDEKYAQTIKKELKPYLKAYCNKDRLGSYTLKNGDIKIDKNEFYAYIRNKDNNANEKTGKNVFKMLDLSKVDINEQYGEGAMKIKYLYKVKFDTMMKTYLEEGGKATYEAFLDDLIARPAHYLSIIGAEKPEDCFEPMGDLFFGATKEMYFKYKSEFLPIWIEFLANIYLYFAASYAILKIVWELVIVRIFGSTLVAMDLNGGEKAKRMLTTILGLYVSLLFIALTLVLYNDAITFIDGNITNNPFIVAIITAMLASIAVDGPNMVAKYFGVETGMRGGAQMLNRGLQSSIRYAKMAQMTHSMHKRNAESARQAAENGNVFTKLRHPIATTQNAVKHKASDLEKSIKKGSEMYSKGLEADKLLNGLKDPTKRKEYRESLFGDKEKQPESANDYKEAINNDMLKRGLYDTDENKEKIDDAANRMYADDLIDNDFLSEADSEQIAEGIPMREAIRDKLIDNGVDGDTAQKLTDSMFSEQIALTDNKADGIYREIATKGKLEEKARHTNAVLNKKAFDSSPIAQFESYKEAAKAYLKQNNIPYTDDTVEHIGAKAYGEANRESLRSAATYERNVGAGQASIAVIMRENLVNNGFTEQNAEFITEQAMRNNAYYEKNKGATNLPGQHG